MHSTTMAFMNTHHTRWVKKKHAESRFKGCWPTFRHGCEIQGQKALRISPQNTKKPAAIYQDDDEETSRRLSSAVIANWNSMEWTKAQSLWGGPTKTFCVEDEPEQLVFSYWTSPTKAFVSSV